MFKSSMEYRDKYGRRITHDQFFENLKDEAIGSAVNHVRDAIESLRCPDHGTAPKLIEKGQQGSELHFDIEACCQKLMDMVNARMS